MAANKDYARNRTISFFIYNLAVTFFPGLQFQQTLQEVKYQFQASNNVQMKH